MSLEKLMNGRAERGETEGRMRWREENPNMPLKKSDERLLLMDGRAPRKLVKEK